ncbi:uncharacterized protein LOC127121440 [Lathyrus oleraceus]|uniref:Uncharacterized protein n=1 Tax=Pisum sativum TaxID=3888 RepID=A0A9D5B6Q0_PEA|nr:uncharacterized protein LOC127121440 [Pisum sativum]KAI5437572.1 hypothetical protein KIW84_023621 [Pisum sativum]
MTMSMSKIGISKFLVVAAGVGYSGNVLIKNGTLSYLIQRLQLVGKRLLKWDQAEVENENADSAHKEPTKKRNLKKSLQERILTIKKNEKYFMIKKECTLSH